MKMAVLSDIHGNLPALSAVADHISRWQPDQVIVAGDVIGGGPLNTDCWAFVQAHRVSAEWQLLRGNHEDYTIAWSDPDAPTAGPEYQLSQLSRWTYQQFNGEIGDIATLPDRLGWQAPDGSTLFATHASIWGNRAGIYPFTPPDEIRHKIAPHPTVFITAHTHIPFIRQVDQTLLINVGSVGLIGDGDRRASYGQLTWSPTSGWQADIVRVAYDIDQTERDFFSSGYLAEAGPGAALTLVELRLGRDAKTRWAHQYRPSILQGDISMVDSVRRFLDNDEFRPYLAGIEIM